tara:strand:+ start:1370 stop:1981 length:612 start_codon:yes stop_codon:yes gene_type:complete
MRIGITLDEVLRDTLTQFLYTYEKYYNAETGLKIDDITSKNFSEFVEFNSLDSMNKFLYEEASLEIFGHADQKLNNLMSKFNNFLIDIKDEEEHSVEIVSREVHSSIPATLFFLSKLSCRAETIRFVQDYEKCWEGIDILVTADPKVLDTKPDDKLSVKIKAPYNSGSSADFELDSILPFIRYESLRDKILNTKITNYENIEK